MTTKIPNNEKILLVLRKYDVKITSSDLAEYCHINNKNIGRYLDALAEKKLISRKTVQVGKKRYKENKILAKGKNKKLNFTYDIVPTHVGVNRYKLVDLKRILTDIGLVAGMEFKITSTSITGGQTTILVVYDKS